jgi:2-methylisocitrate lyase-like PEP mutase family enzyme
MKTGSLRELIRTGEFLHMPAVYDPLGGLLVQRSGFKVYFVGGYVTGAALAISEPLLPSRWRSKGRWPMPSTCP